MADREHHAGGVAEAHRGSTSRRVKASGFSQKTCLPRGRRGDLLGMQRVRRRQHDAVDGGIDDAPARSAETAMPRAGPFPRPGIGSTARRTLSFCFRQRRGDGPPPRAEPHDRNLDIAASLVFYRDGLGRWQLRPRQRRRHGSADCDRGRGDGGRGAAGRCSDHRRGAGRALRRVRIRMLKMRCHVIDALDLLGGRCARSIRKSRSLTSPAIPASMRRR